MSPLLYSLPYVWWYVIYVVFVFPDKSKYGYRMLQQMGWQEGKGLGSKEDGDTQHVKISKKRDSAGKWSEV